MSFPNGAAKKHMEHISAAIRKWWIKIMTVF